MIKRLKNLIDLIVMEAYISIKLDTIIEQAKAKIILYLKAAEISSQELERRMTQIKEKAEHLNESLKDLQPIKKIMID